MSRSSTTHTQPTKKEAAFVRKCRSTFDRSSLSSSCRPPGLGSPPSTSQPTAAPSSAIATAASLAVTLGVGYAVRLPKVLKSASVHAQPVGSSEHGLIELHFPLLTDAHDHRVRGVVCRANKLAPIVIACRRCRVGGACGVVEVEQEAAVVIGLVGERGHLLFTTYVAAVGDSPTFAQFREYAGGLLGALAVYIRADH